MLGKILTEVELCLARCGCAVAPTIRITEYAMKGMPVAVDRHTVTLHPHDAQALAAEFSALWKYSGCSAPESLALIHTIFGCHVEYSCLSTL